MSGTFTFRPRATNADGLTLLLTSFLQLPAGEEVHVSLVAREDDPDAVRVGVRFGTFVAVLEERGARLALECVEKMADAMPHARADLQRLAQGLRRGADTLRDMHPSLHPGPEAGGTVQ